MSSSHSDGSGKTVVDSIHGDIHLKAREVQVIDTASFQRLRQLKQLAMAQLVYPAATHTRFAHSIGALGTMVRILHAAAENGVKFEEEEEDNLRLAALLHDVGHYPYSHLMESVDRVKLTEEVVDGTLVPTKSLDERKSKYPDHEEIGTWIVAGQDDLVKAIGSRERAKAVADLLTRSKVGEPQLSKLIHSSLDLDRLDYLPRDSHGTGVPYGYVDRNYLLSNLKVSPQKMVGFSEKAVHAVEHLLLARFFMYRAVYYHKTIHAFEETCRQLLRRLRDNSAKCSEYGIPANGDEVKELVTSEKLFTFTDAFVDGIIQRAANDKEGDRVIMALAKTIQKREPPMPLKEVPVCEEMTREHHAGKTFKSRCRGDLSRLANEFGIPLGQFILCETKQLTVGERPQALTASEASQLKQEEVLEQSFRG